MNLSLLDHLRDDIFCTLESRSAVPTPELRANPEALWASVGVFALRDIPAGTVIDRSIDGVDSHSNFLCLAAGTSWPVPLDPNVEAELRLRCLYNDKRVIPRYGLNIFRLLSFVKQSEQSNCAFETKQTSVPCDNPKSILVRRAKRTGRRAKPALKKRPSGQMFKALTTTRFIAQGEEILLPVTDLEALEHGVERKSGWTPAEQRLFHHLQHGIYCALGASRYGVGVYAIRDIPKGSLVDLTLGSFDAESNLRVLPWTSVEANKVPLTVQNQLKKHYQTDEGGLIQISRYGFNLLRLVSFINHASEGNVDFKFLTGKGYAHIFTTRDVRAGEELGINYHEYLSEEHKLWPMFAFLQEESKHTATTTTTPEHDTAHSDC